MNIMIPGKKNAIMKLFRGDNGGKCVAKERKSYEIFIIYAFCGIWYQDGFVPEKGTDSGYGHRNR